MDYKASQKIVFLLPNCASKPVGGVKMVLEYANRFAKDGCEVSLIYAAYSKWCKFGLLHTVFYLYQFCKAKFTKNYLPKWFDVDPSIKQNLIWSLDRYDYPKDAKIVATAVDTAYYLNQYNIDVDNKYYFIQDYENWFVDDDFVKETFHYPMRKIVISKWLRKIIINSGEDADLVPNGFDTVFFQLQTPIKDRSPFELIALYHMDKRKGLDVAFKAFEIVKEKFPQLHVTLFGTPSQPEKLPDWYSYYQRPDEDTFNRIYNHASIFVGSSYTEGWGLTVGEAMLCGCAVACTDNNGYLEMAKDGETALVSPVGDANALADNMTRLLADNQLRIAIAQQGNRMIQEFDIEIAYRQIKRILFEE